MRTGPILLGIDDSERRRDAVALARTLAAALDAPVLVAHVHAVDPFPAGAASHRYTPKPASAAEALVAEAAGALGPDRPHETVLLASSSPARGLYDLAEERDARLVVLGTARRGAVGRLLLGSVGERLLQGCPCPVAVAPPGYGAGEPAPLRRVGVGYDGSPEADVALDFAGALAQRVGAALRLWNVVAPAGSPDDADWDDYRRWLDGWAQGQLDRGLARVPAGVDAAGAVLVGDAGEQLAAHGAEVDLLATGSRGYGPARRVLLGSASAALLRHAPCPVVVLPRGAEAA